MKKTLISLAALMIATPVLAAYDCAYSPLQNLIRNVRKPDEIQNLINSGVVFSEKTRCGGSLMQLAILRGNPQVLQALLNQDPNRANETAELAYYPIQGAPKEVPLLLFASYYAPNEQMIDLLFKYGADATKTDSAGRNLLWYMEQNPVLRNTDLYDNINTQLLKALAQRQQPIRPGFTAQPAPQGQGGYVPSTVPPQIQEEQKQAKPTVLEASD